MKILKLILALSLFFSLAACSDDDNSVSTPEKISKGIWPMAVGNTWAYETQYFDSDLENKSTLIFCDSALQINGQSVYKLFSGDDIIYLQNNTDGVYLGSDKPASDFFIEYKYPCSVGDTFSKRGNQVLYTVESISDKITVPAGTFTCIKYVNYDKYEGATEAENEYYKRTEWFCPGVGIIMIESADSTATTGSYKPWRQMKLKHYVIK